MVKDILKSMFRRFGLELIRWPDQRNLSGHLITLVEAVQPDLVLDVGANEGQFAARLRNDAGYRGRLLSFEPTPETFSRLKHNAESDEKWKVSNLAVGSESGSIRLHLFSESKWNSSRELDTGVVAASGRHLDSVGSAEVRVVRLDEIWPENAFRVFLKSDTQGNEIEVLNSLGHCSQFVAGLLLEAPLRQFYENEPSFQEIVGTAISMGFQPTGFFPVSRARGSLELDTVDVTFIRRG